MSQVNDFEKMILSSDTYLVKLYFSISKNEQKLRLDKLANDPLRHWKISSLDQKAQRLWNSYTKYKELMFKKTNTKLSPWQKIDANNKFQARLEAIKIVLSLIPYKSSVENVTNSSKAPRKKLLSK
jgi:polyphosphate kinase 2 (PPK2 family)